MPIAFGAFPAIFGLGAGFFVLVFVLVIGGFIFAIVKGISTWAWNNEQPIQTAAARLVSKRTDTSGMGSNMNNTGGSVNTWYYVTFEIDGGERKEFGMSGHEYGLLAQGDSGSLTYQGTRYKGFARSAA